MHTEFGEIGRLVPKNTKFLVAELLPVHRTNSDVDDGGLLQKIEALVEPVRSASVEMNITILCTQSGYLVKDGNKRTVAFYEIGLKSGTDAISFPVFVLTPNNGT